LLSEKRPDVNVVAYTVMKKCLDMSMDTGQEHAIQAFDQQLYTIAQQVKWSGLDIIEPHILRLGCFHSLSSLFSY